MATSNELGCIEIWDLFDRKKIHSLNQHKEIASDIKWMNLDPRTFISCSIDKTIKIWKDYKVINELGNQDDWLRSLGVKNDDSLMISGCVQGKAIGWDLPTCKKIFKIELLSNINQMNTINSVNIWEEKGLISIGSKDGICRFYDQREPLKPIYELKAHEKGINKIDFSTRDQTFYTSGRNNRINIWDIRQLKEYKPMTQKFHSGNTGNEIINPQPVFELDKHICQSHHIQSGYMQDSKYIITGSEENLIYIYNTTDGH